MIITNYIAKKYNQFVYNLIPLPTKNKTRVAEEILYPKTVYPIYLQVQNNFKFCMQNRLLTRNEVLEFKFMINSSVKQKDYKYEKWTNDTHEIYTKLKSTNISRKQMLVLNNYLSKRLIEIPEPIQVYGNLRLIK